MKTLRASLAVLLLALLNLVLAQSAHADGMVVIHNTDVAVRPGHPVYAPLEIRKHIVEVKIDDQVAVTSVDQVFFNPSGQRLEGTYMFPVPEGAHIDKFTMEINGKPVEAELLSADKARALYEDIVRKAKDPALLEYAGREMFKVRIFPIEPNSEKRITLKYTQLLKSDNGLVNYTYGLNTEKFSAKLIPVVAVHVDITTKQPLKTVYSPSHTVEVKQSGEHHAVVGFEARDVRPDTDFQVLFAPQGPRDGQIAVNLLTFKDPGSGGDSANAGYFMLLASPGILGDSKQVTPQDVVFVVDTSGSMAGDKLAQAQKAMKFCLANLNEKDRFQVIRFSSEAEPLFGGLVENTAKNRGRAQEFVNGFKAIGGTALHEALLAAVAPARETDKDRPYVVIFLTDGQPTVGPQDEGTILAALGKAVGERTVRVFCFGIGTDVNTKLLDKITQQTRAASQYVLPNEDIEVKVSNFYARIASPVLTGLKLTFGDKIHVSRLYPNALPDLFVGDQLVIFGSYTGQGHATVELEGLVAGKKRAFVTEANFTDKNTEYEYIPRLWATRRVGFLLDEIRLHGENAELKDEVTQLARRYGIVTPYTSYLILEEEGRRGVPVAMQTQSQIVVSDRLKEGAAREYMALRDEKAGDKALDSSSWTSGMKNAGGGNASLTPSPAAPGAMAHGETQVGAAINGPAGAGGDRVGKPGENNYTNQQSRMVRNRAFYQNGSQWIDAGIQANVKANRVQVKFNSDEYFALMKKHADMPAWLAQAKNVQVLLNNTIYEVVD